VLIDMHVHTSETSLCAEISARKLVEKYKALGYDGFVVSDHMKPDELQSLEVKSWRKKAEYWLRGYRKAKAAAGKDFTVLLGMEIRFLDSHNDYLLYGIDEDFVFKNSNLHKYRSLRAFRPLAEKHGVLIVQAHPFRRTMTICDHKLLDGMEVLNANHENNNEIAKLWAEKYGLIPTAGTDYHGWGDVHYGLRLKEFVRDSKELARVLRSRKYEIVVK